MANSALENELRSELYKIDVQRMAIVDSLKDEYLDSSEHWRYANGTFVMVPLIQARSNILLALALLKAEKRK